MADFAPPFAPLSVENWRARIVQELKGQALESLLTPYPEGPRLPFYTAEHLPKGVAVPLPLQATQLLQRLLPSFNPEDQIAAASREGFHRYLLTDTATAYPGLNIPEEAEIWALNPGAGKPVARSQAWANDPLHTAAYRGSWAASALEDWQENVPSLLEKDIAAVWVYGYYAQAGASHTQELAFSLLALATYYQACPTPLQEKLLNQAVISLETTSDFLGTLAKFRALRVLWQRYLQTLGLPNLRQPTVIAHVGDFTFSTVQVYNNLVRATTEAAAALAGGASFLSIAPHALNQQDTLTAQRLARHVYLVLKHEAGLLEVLDPTRGSYAVESLTYTLANQAWDLFEQLQAAGDFVAALTRGHLAQAISQTRQPSGTVVGETKYTLANEPHLTPPAPIVHPNTEFPPLRRLSRVQRIVAHA